MVPIRYFHTSFKKMVNLFSVLLNLTFQNVAVTLRTNTFNIQQFYMVLTLRLYVLYGSQIKERLFPYTQIRDCFKIVHPLYFGLMYFFIIVHISFSWFNKRIC
jgi:hypothetical protein